jgi:hypothetical protein
MNSEYASFCATNITSVCDCNRTEEDYRREINSTALLLAIFYLVILCIILACAYQCFAQEYKMTNKKGVETQAVIEEEDNPRMHGAYA